MYQTTEELVRAALTLYTWQELADITETSMGAISRWRRGESEMRYATAVKIYNRLPDKLRHA